MVQWYLLGGASVHLPPNTCFIGPTRVQIPNVTSSVQPLYNRPPFSPLKLPLPTGDLNPHLIHGSLGLPESSTQTASPSVQPFLQGLRLWQTDRPSVTISRIYVCSTAMRPKSSIRFSQDCPAAALTNHSDSAPVMCCHQSDIREFLICII